MYLSYENELGKVEMGGGSHPLWNIIDITGLGWSGKEYNTVKYAGQDGQQTLSETSNARTITLSGDIKNDGQLQYELTRAIRIFNKPGTLKIQAGDKQRMIACRVNTFEPDKQNGAVQTFVLQLIADNPAFEDFVSTVIPVFKRVDNILNSFTLPMVFTTRTNEVNILNLGDLKSEPVFYITNSGGTGGGEDVGFRIDNHTTDQHITLVTTTVPGEVITIDIAKRKITSSINGNVINCISADTFLNDFWLDVGSNDIVVTNYNANETIVVVCEYSNKYIEAVY